VEFLYELVESKLSWLAVACQSPNPRHSLGLRGGGWTHPMASDSLPDSTHLGVSKAPAPSRRVDSLELRLAAPETARGAPPGGSF